MIIRLVFAALTMIIAISAFASDCLDLTGDYLCRDIKLKDDAGNLLEKEEFLDADPENATHYKLKQTKDTLNIKIASELMSGDEENNHPINREENGLLGGSIPMVTSGTCGLKGVTVTKKAAGQTAVTTWTPLKMSNEFNDYLELEIIIKVGGNVSKKHKCLKAVEPQISK